jgi:hypothetical protein
MEPLTHTRIPGPRTAYNRAPVSLRQDAPPPVTCLSSQTGRSVRSQLGVTYPTFCQNACVPVAYCRAYCYLISHRFVSEQSVLPTLLSAQSSFPNFPYLNNAYLTCLLTYLSTNLFLPIQYISMPEGHIIPCLAIVYTSPFGITYLR